MKRPSLSIPSPWLIGGILLLALWIGWAIYVAADRSVDKALGVLIAWPTLLLIAALVAAPIAAIAYFVVKLVRDRRSLLAEAGSDTDQKVTD